MKQYYIGEDILPNNLKRMLRIMKAFVVLIFTCFLSIYANTGYSQGQNMSMELRKTTIQQIFNQIEKSSDFIFVLADNTEQSVKKEVNIKVKDESVSEILEKVLSGTDLTYKILDKQIVIYKDQSKKSEDTSSLNNVEQNITVKGNITDSKGEPLPGVSVKVIGASIGTITNIDGNFTLSNISPNTRLEVSFIGMLPQTVDVNGRQEFKIILQENIEALDEVIVVGYGQQKKSTLTGSVVQVSSEELTRVPLSNVSQALTGKLPGVVFKQNSGQPGLDEATMLVRGSGTYNDSKPLFLVDGVERAFNNIDPNDVESVSVLKDASAAVYGVKGAHGVILITTKRGKTDKPVVTYNGSVSFSENTQFPEFLTGTEYAYWHNKGKEMDGKLKWFTEEQIAMMSNGDPSDGLENTDWVNKFLGQSAPSTQHNLSISGGTENARYFASVGMMDQNGFVKDMTFQRYNVRTNLDLMPNKSWKISLNLAGRMEKSHTPGALSFEKQQTWNPISQAYFMFPFLPFEYKGLPTSSSSMTFNPFAAVELSGFQKGVNTTIETSAQISYTPTSIEGLNVSIFGSYDRKSSEGKSLSTPYISYSYEPETGKYSKVTAAGFLADGSLYQTSGSNEYMVIRPSIEYTKEFGKHHVGGLFLFEFQKGIGNNMYAQRWGYPLTDLPELSFGQMFPPIPNSGKSNESARAGFLSRFNYSYDSRYLLEFAFREDASYKFPKDSRWGFFPSASVGWLVSEENFFEDLKPIVDKFKIRGSAGMLGKDNVDEFLFRQDFKLSEKPLVAFGKDKLEPQFGLESTTSYPSLDLTWEKTNIYNIGFELVMWNGLLSAEVDGFYKYTYDILQGVRSTYPSSLGGNYPKIINSGSVDVRGIEVQLGHRNKVGDFQYSISGNISYSKNKILSKIETENINPWQSMIGKSIGQRLAFVATGLIQTEEQLQNSPWFTTGGYKRLGDIMYKDLNGDGKLDYNSDVAVATRPEMPDLMYALNFEATYKNFDFSMMWQGSALNDILLTGVYDNEVPDGTIFTKPFYGMGYNTARYILEDSWTPEHTNARYPRLSHAVSGPNSVNSTWWIEDGAYVRLKNLSIGYSIPSSILKKINIQSLRVYVAGSNLLTFAGFKYLDPEMPSVNNGYYPQQRTYSCGLTLTF